MASPKQIYTAKLNEITARYLAREEAQVRQAVALLKELRQNIGVELTLSGSDFDTFKYKSLQANIERQLVALEGELVNGLQNSIEQVFLDGVEAVVEPLRAVGYDNAFFAPSRAQILTVSEFSADLIRGMTSEMLAKINAQLRQGALGVLSPFELMQNITKILGVGKQVVSGIALRAESIVRSELARIFNLANYTAQQDTLDAIPDLLKRWIATGDSRTRPAHLEAHIKYMENPIPAKEPFIVDGEELDYPGDPKGSPGNVIACRCRTQSIVPEIGVLASPLDARVKKQMELQEV